MPTIYLACRGQDYASITKSKRKTMTFKGLSIYDFVKSLLDLYFNNVSVISLGKGKTLITANLPHHTCPGG